MGQTNQVPQGNGYSLVFGEGSLAVELEAWDRASAFATAQRLVRHGRPATLLEAGLPIARLSYSPEGFWTVSDLGRAA